MNSKMKFFAITALLAVFGVALAQSAPTLPPINSPASGESLPGKFIWFDFATPDFANQKAFYSTLFGWSYENVQGTADGYSLIRNRGRAIGGTFSFEPPGGEQDGASWIALMSHPDPDEAAKTVQANGGKVNVSPATIPGRGRHALFEDPSGAQFGVIASSSGDPADRDVELGDFLWVDLFAQDIDAMSRFYSALAPYSQERREVVEGVDRIILSAHGMPRAGIVPVDEEANRSTWIPYIRVADVEATLEKVVDGGGFTIVAPDPVLLDGNLAVFVDPNGGVMGIVKWEDEEAAQ